MGKVKVDLKGRINDSIDEFDSSISIEPQTSRPRKEKHQYSQIPISLISNKENIRKTFNEEALTELSESLIDKGQIQPCTVYEEDGDFILITGERRFLAAKKAGLKNLNCIIVDRPKNDADRIVIQAIENEIRENVSSVEREEYIKQLSDMGFSDEEICNKLHKSRAWLSIARGASIVREKHGNDFVEAGVELVTKDAYALKDSTPDEIESIIQEVKAQSTPTAKKKAVKKAIEKKKTQNKGNEPKEPIVNDDDDEKDIIYPDLDDNLGESFPMTTDNDDNLDALSIKFMFSIDKENKKYLIDKVYSGPDEYKELHDKLENVVIQHFENMEYSLDKGIV